MPGLIDEIVKSLGPQVTKNLTSTLGLQPKAAAQVLPMVAPLILGGLKRQMENQGGAPRVDHILNKYGSDSVLDDIGGLFTQKAQAGNPDPGLGGLLGPSGIQAAGMLASKLKIDAGTAMKIIPMIAPLVLGALTRKRDSGGAGLAGIASLLDSDGDGNILDDVAGFLTQGQGGNLLGGLLGGLLKKK
jgi:hypothetical protein